VNGKGQKGEGAHWTQPLRGADADMTKLAQVTGFKQDGPVTVVEGEARGAYADLTRYRRTVIWVEGAYVLVLDDIAAKQDCEITWMIQGKQVKAVDKSAGHFRLGSETAGCDLLFATATPYSAGIVPSTAANREKLLGFEQLQLKAKTTQWRLATLLDPWKRQASVSLASAQGSTFRVTITTADNRETWLWTPPADDKTPSTLQAQRPRGKPFTFGPSEH
jgi:hypothetical protein